VLYFSGEESGSQVKLRAERLGSGDAMAFLAVTDVLDIVATLRKEKPVFAVVDSVQTLEISDNPAEAGTVSQVRGAAGFLVQAAKELNVPLLLIGHVTKDGTVAGPKTLEHMVDAVFVFEGERSHPLRVLRSLKNRFGATDESGMFSMDGTGLVEVSNPSAFLLEERQLGVPGSVISCMTGGSRPMLIEIQALVQKSAFGYPVRRASGFDHERLEMIVAIIGRHGKVNLGESDVFVNIVGGLKAREPALDLAVALAVCSAATGVALPQGLAAFGELGLGGEVRSVIGLEKRLFEASSFGLAEVVTAVPKGWKGGGGVARGKSPVMVRGVRSLIDALVVCREKVTSAS
jgi:DNA repair protein RadA/Sms